MNASVFAAAAAASLGTLTLAIRPAEARPSAGQCIDANNVVQSDCLERIDELDRAQPTLVFDVKDAAGNDLLDVSVSIDGRSLSHKLTGVALQVDPGEHTFTFDTARQPSTSRRFVLKEGEKARRERIVLGPAAAPLPVFLPADVSRAHSDNFGTQRGLGLVAGGIGVAGIAVGTVFGLLASSANNAQKSDCASASSCVNRAQALDDHSALQTDGAISTVAFVVGGGLLAIGGVLLLTAHTAPAQSPRAAIVITSVGPSLGGFAVRGAF
jgi:hypothetical protein